MSFLSQSAEYLPAVSAATKGSVYINAIGLDSKPVDALPKEYWYMICLSRLDH
jgi:hypothetical protein